MMWDIALGILLGGILLAISGVAAVAIYIAIFFFLDLRDIRKQNAGSNKNIRRGTK